MLLNQQWGRNGRNARNAGVLGAIMASYRIELRTDARVWDSLHVESADLYGLRLEMARFVGELLRDHAAQLWADQEWRVDVVDDQGLILFVMQILVSDSAATMHLDPTRL